MKRFVILAPQALNQHIKGNTSNKNNMCCMSLSGLITCSIFIIIIPSSHINSTKLIKSSKPNQLLYVKYLLLKKMFLLNIYQIYLNQNINSNKPHFFLCGFDVVWMVESKWHFWITEANAIQWKSTFILIYLIKIV